MAPAAAALAAALLLAGCSDDDGDGDGPPGAGGLASGGGGEDGGGIDDIELETTGGFGDAGGDSGGDAGAGAGGGDDWYAHWESADGITLYTTTDGVLYGNSSTSDVCTQDAGIAGSLDWEPVLFSCESSPFANATLRLDGETMAIEWSDRTEEVTKVEGLAGQSIDLAALETTILD